MENIEKENKRLKVLIVIMIIVLLGVGCYHYYVTYINVDKCANDSKVNEKQDDNLSYEEISGYYTAEIQENSTSKTSYSLYLYDNGTFSFSWSYMAPVGFIGNYTIKGNQIILNPLYDINSGASKSKTKNVTTILTVNQDKTIDTDGYNFRGITLKKSSDGLTENQFDHYFNYDEE